MRKGLEVILFSVFIILTISFISASYECADGSSMTEGQREVDVGDRKSINGLSLGVMNADETPVFNTYSAELLIDARKFSLTDGTNTTDVELVSGEKTITMFNLSSNLARIGVDGTIENVEEGTPTTIGSFLIFLSSMVGEYPGTATIEGIIGKEEITLDNDVTMGVVSLGGVDYLLELFSASDTNAIVNVKKCSDETIKIVEIQDEVDEPEEIDDPIVNDTEPGNETIDSGNATEDGEPESEEKIPVIVFIILFGAIGMILVVFLIMYLKARKEEV